MTLPGFGGDEIKGYKKPVRIFTMTDYFYREWLHGVKSYSTGCGGGTY